MDNLETLERELKIVEEKLETFSDVITQIKELKKEKKAIRDKMGLIEPKFIETNDEYILSLDDASKNKEVKELIDAGVREYLSDVISDIHWGETIEDEGLDHEGYALIGTRVYKYNVHYDSEWCGEWSMRKNIIDHSSAEVTIITEIPADKFEITYNDEEVGQIFNAKIQIN